MICCHLVPRRPCGCFESEMCHVVTTWVLGSKPSAMNEVLGPQPAVDYVPFALCLVGRAWVEGLHTYGCRNPYGLFNR